AHAAVPAGHHCLPGAAADQRPAAAVVARLDRPGLDGEAARKPAASACGPAGCLLRRATPVAAAAVRHPVHRAAVRPACRLASSPGVAGVRWDARSAGRADRAAAADGAAGRLVAAASAGAAVGSLDRLVLARVSVY